MLRGLALGAFVLLTGGTGCVERLITLGEGADRGEDAGRAESSDGEGPGAGDVITDCVDDQDCAELQNCFSGTCVTSGAMRVSLSWDVVSDFDLHLRVPSGSEISFELKSADGGQLDLDDCVAGECREEMGVHVENIVFPQACPPGEYAVWVENFDSRRKGNFVIEVAGEVTAQFLGEVKRAPHNVSEEFLFDH
jgi:uncharacterized protein YfaP (DUF2135 family)